VIYLFPYIPVIGKMIPSPLVCILLGTAVAILFDINIRTVGDMGQLPDTLPLFLWPQVEVTWQTLSIIFPYSMAMALLMT